MATVKSVTITRIVEFIQQEGDHWPEVTFSQSLMLRPETVEVTYEQAEDGLWVFKGLVLRGRRVRYMRDGNVAMHGPGQVSFPYRTAPAVFDRLIVAGSTAEAICHAPEVELEPKRIEDGQVL